MKNAFQPIIASLFAAICLFEGTSCTNFFSQTIDADPPEYEKSLVFHTFTSDRDSFVRVELTRNFGIFDDVRGTKSWYVGGAVAEWWIDGRREGYFRVATDSATLADSVVAYEYVLSAPVKAGQRCEIRVSHPDFEPVRAEQTMPSLLYADVPQLKRNVANEPSGGSEIHEVSITIQDTPGEKNYYAFLLRRKERMLTPIFSGTQVTFDTIEYERSYYFNQETDPNFQQGVNSMVLLPDQFFDGNSYRFVGRFTHYDNGAFNQDSVPYTLIVRKCTEAYYRWSLSYAKQYDAQGNPFIEPILVFSNVENGLGIFGLFSERKFELQ